MGGQSSQKTTSSSQSEPWGPAVPALQGILSGIQSQMGNYQANPDEQAALAQITANSKGLKDWSPQATNLANQFMTGDPTGLLGKSLGAYNSVADPIANASLDPTQTPGIQNVLNTIRGDVSNSVNGMFAGAGRDLSGLNQQTLARGIAQGEAVPLLNQYNQNVQNALGAAGGRFAAAGNTAGAMGANQKDAFGFASLIPQLQNAGPMGVLAAQSMARQLPLQNLGMLANLTVPIAGLGGQRSGESTTTSNPSMLSNIGGWLNVLSAGKALLSDRRLKTDIEQIGTTFSGKPIYRFRYVDLPAMHIGLMADEVEKYAPEAVGAFGGFKTVDYELATNGEVR